MTSGTNSVLFSDFAYPVDRFEYVIPEAEYRLLGMRSRIGGPFHRETKSGGELSASRLNRVRSGDFIFSRLFAWQGSFGVIPAELGECYVSNEFPLFQINLERAVPRYLVYWFGLPHIQQSVEADCTGTTPGTRNRYSKDRFLRLRIDLPPLPEQQRIVKKIDAITSRLDEAKRLRQEILDDANALLVAMAHRNDLSPETKKAQGWREVQLGSVLRQSKEAVEVMPGEEYPHFGIYSFGKGLFRKPLLLGDQIKTSRLYRASEGQFIYGRLNAYEGAFGIVSKEFDGSFVTNEFPIFDCDLENVLPDFVLAYFAATATWEVLKRQVTGIGGGAGNRRIRLKEAVFLAQRISLPPWHWQDKIRSVGDRLTQMRSARSATEEDLDALLPAILDKAFKGAL